MESYILVQYQASIQSQTRCLRQAAYLAIPREDIGKLINHWKLRSGTSIQLVHLCTIGNALSSHYRFCNKLQFLFVRGSQLDRLLGAVDKHLMLTQLVYTKYDVNALRYQDYKVGDKVYPPYFKIHLWA
jgi:hypothetical protein